MNNNLVLLPQELIMDIIQYLDSGSLRMLKNTCLPMFKLINHPRFTRFIPSSELTDVEFRSFSIKLHHTEDLNWIYDHQVVARLDNDGYINKYMGCRLKSDRCLFSRLAINAQFYNSDSVYFEITVLEARVEGSMRIGLVAPGNDCFHPPGCVTGIGYNSVDGNVALSSQDGDRFQFGPSWSVKDTVGAGLRRDNCSQTIVYFTLNGNLIGEAPVDIDGTLIDYSGFWHAAFSSSGPCHVKINTGQDPFLYKKIDEALIKTDISSMEPYFLPVISDPFQKPSVDNNIIQMPNNGSNIARVVISNSPIHAINDSSYFEIKVLHQGVGFNSFMAIGLSIKPTNPFHQIGWNRSSIGYHSDDGKVYISTHQNGIQFGPSFTVNDIIGCGYDLKSQCTFFSLNGNLLGQFKTSHSNAYPAVSAITDWRLQINFGDSPFQYKAFIPNPNDFQELY
jgi:hypothetical protein